MKRFLTVVFIAAAAISTSAQFAAQEEVPAYNAAPPKKGEKLPPILSGDQLTGPNFSMPVQVNAYKAAAKVPATLHQLPCYCHCDRNHGHNSLHSCFESDHGAHCGVCMAEAFFAAEQAKKGRTAKQIREAVIRGDYKSMDLQKYNVASKAN
jgi:hypothetical protein